MADSSIRPYLQTVFYVLSPFALVTVIAVLPVHHDLGMFVERFAYARMIFQELLELGMAIYIRLIRCEASILPQILIDLRVFIQKLIEFLDLPIIDVAAARVPSLFLAKHSSRILFCLFPDPRVFS